MTLAYSPGVAAKLVLFGAVLAFGVACGGRAQHSNSDASALPSMRIVFPPRVSYSDAETIVVRGTTRAEQALTGVTVNDVAAVSDDQFATWQARVPLHSGSNEIHALATDVAGNQLSDAVTLNNAGAPIGIAHGLQWNAPEQRLLILNDASQLLSWDPATGSTTTLSDSRDGAEPKLWSPRALALDLTHDRALVLDGISDALLAIDLKTGVRRTVVEWASSDPAPNAVTVDARGLTAFVVATLNRASRLLRVDLETGDWTVLSGGGAGTGPDFTGSLVDLAYDDITDPRAPRLLAPEVDNGPIWAVDALTGERSVLREAEPSAPDAPRTSPLSIELDAAEKRALISEFTAQSGTALFAVNLETGAQTRLVEAMNEPDSPVLSYWHRIAFDPVSRRLYAGRGTQGFHDASDLLALDLETGERTLIDNARVGAGAPLTNVGGVAHLSHDDSTGTLLVCDAQRGSLVRIDLSTGDRSQLSGAERGEGPALKYPVDVIVHGASALFLDGGGPPLSRTESRLFRVDLGTGKRSTISGDGRGAGPPLDDARTMTLDAKRNRVLVTCPFCEQPGVYVVALDSGDRAALSTAAHGTGLDASRTIGITLDTVSDRAIAQTGQTLFAIDLASGDRSELPSTDPYAFDVLSALIFDPNANRTLATSMSGGVLSIAMGDLSRSLISGGDTFATGAGLGPSSVFPRSLSADFRNQLVYVGDQARGALLAIDLRSGERTIVSR